MLNRRHLMASMAAFAASPATAEPVAVRRRLILVLADGGWDTTMGLDPKLGIAGVDGPEVDEDPDIADDVESVETYNGIDIATNVFKRPSVDRFFSTWGSRCTVIRGLWTGSLAHGPAMDRVVTGAWPDQPDVAVRVGAAGTSPLGTVDLTGLSRPGPLAGRLTRLGASGQIRGLVDPKLLPSAIGTTSKWTPSASDDADIATWLHARRNGLATGVASWDKGHLENLSDADARMRTLDGWTPGAVTSDTLAGDGVIVANLMLAGLCDAAVLTSRVTWDTHSDNSRQHRSHDTLFAGLGFLAQTLDGAGLLDSVVVAVMSELARTPWLNTDLGKDHWPWTAALVFGGGVRGSEVLGATDNKMAGLPVDGELITYDRVVAGLLEAAGVDPSISFPTTQPLSLG